MLFAYIRVSSKEQNPERQIRGIKLYAPEIKEESIFTDIQSGKDFERPAYQMLKEKLRWGDRLIVKELDRLGRNKQGIEEELLWMKEQGIQLRILNIPTTLMEPPKESTWVMGMINNLLIEVFSSIAEQERETIRSRQKEGIELAKKEGKYKGRKKAPLPKNFPSLYERWKKGQITGVEFTKLLGYKSRNTVYRKVREWEGRY